jgi:geranylgeranyl pyrophosphate synthase
MQLGCLHGAHRVTTINFITPVQEKIQEVEDLIRSQTDGYHPDLRLALDHLLSSGGKRIRPALILLTGRMLGASDASLITLAAAIELLHTATLVHDDLIDSALLRRGIPTLNSQWSPGATVLTGDFIFARAAKLAADTNSVEVMKLFAQTLSTIVNGEITQLFSSRCYIDRDKYYSRIYAKTASLFETSTSAAAMISPNQNQSLEAIRDFGHNIGMAFQIVDDILDFTGEQATIGKPVGSDLRQGLITLPTIIYIEDHPDDLDIKYLPNGHWSPEESHLDQLIESIRSSNAISSAYFEAETFIRKGITRLQQLQLSEERQALEELAEYIVHRKA